MANRIYNFTALDTLKLELFLTEFYCQPKIKTTKKKIITKIVSEIRLQ